MPVLAIRPQQRFAVRRGARLRKPGKRGEAGLLIELSREGCRISTDAAQAFAPDQDVILRIDGAAPITGSVRWRSVGAIGLRFQAALPAPLFDGLLTLCRPAANQLRGAA